MSIDKEFKQIMSDVEFALSKSDTLSVQQISTNIINALTPKHYDTISIIYAKYPELEDLEGASSDIEILTDDEVPNGAINDIIDIFNNIKTKYNC